MPEKTPPVLEADLGEYGGPFEFDSLDQIEKGINEEKRRWSWIQDARPAGVGDSKIWECQADILYEVRETIRRARQVHATQSGCNTKNICQRQVRSAGWDAWTVGAKSAIAGRLTAAELLPKVIGGDCHEIYANYR